LPLVVGRRQRPAAAEGGGVSLHLAPVVAAIRWLNAPVLTKAGAPVAVATASGPVRAIFFRDPDGYIVEAIESLPPGR